MSASDTASQRLLSLDVFRGATIASMIIVNNPGNWGHIYSQLDHAEWFGWTFTDLIFPFFLFVAGVSIALSRSKEGGGPKSGLYLKIIRRSIVLFLLGLFLNGFPDYDLSVIRVMGVLQRIAICYFFSAVVYLETGIAAQATVAVLLLLVYWVAMMLFPTPGIGAGVLEKGRNFAAYVDALVLGKHVWANTKTWDPEGVISTIPAVSTMLFGVLTGAWLKTERARSDKAIGMLTAGIAGMVVGGIWGLFLPISKNLWTSSYAVFMSGFALVVLGACYYLIEERNIRRWGYPFEVLGMNSITVFVLSGIVGRMLILWKIPFHGKMRFIKSVIYERCFGAWLSPINASLAYALAFLAVMYIAMWALYKKKIFVKI